MMNSALWIVAALLATIFVLAGPHHDFQSLEMLAKDQRTHWVRDLPPAAVRFIGVSELLAAAGLGSVMLCALVFHITRREFTAVPIMTVLLALAAVVAYGRAVLAPFS